MSNKATSAMLATATAPPSPTYVAYYRVSTPKQGRSALGLDSQKAGIHDYCTDRLIGEFIEVESAGKASRKEFLKAVAFCKLHNAKLIAFSLDRLLRSLDILVSLRQSKVRFMALDCLNDSEVIIQLKASLAEDELRKVSERTRNALAQKKARGFKLGKPENLTEAARLKGAAGNQRRAADNENNRRAASMVDLMRRAGKNFSQIAVELNRAGFQTAWGGQFQSVQVKRLAERQIDAVI